MIHGDSQKVPGRYVTQLGWMSPPKKLAAGVILGPFGMLNFTFSRFLLGEFLTIDQIDFFQV